MALIIPLAACGDDDAASGPKIDVTFKEWSIGTSAPSVAAGAVTFVVKNNGKEEHEFILLKTDLAPDKLEVVNSKVDEDKFESPGEVEEVAPSKTKSGSFTLKPGHYLLICNLPTHYEQGMRAEFTVK
jgi:uncharacterized cupredoxin-like copper-binding protein